MSTIFWKEELQDNGKIKRATNISYNCVDRHLRSMVDKNGDALIWEGNYWDDDVHDCAELSWNTVNVLINKIANVLCDLCKKCERILLLLPNVIQLPLSIMACSRIGIIPIIMDPSSCDVILMSDLLRETQCRLIITIDGYWQGNNLCETKKQLDDAINSTEGINVERVIVVRHTGPNPGVPPPDKEYPGRRPCYALKVPFNDGVDVEWSQLIRQARTSCDIKWLTADHPFVELPQWIPSLQLISISTGQILSCASGVLFTCKSTDSVLALGHPQTSFGLLATIAPWLKGHTLAIFEGTLNYPDPSRLRHIIAKFEINTLLLPPSTLDYDYLSLVQCSSLKRIFTTHEFEEDAASNFPGVEQMSRIKHCLVVGIKEECEKPITD